MWISIYILNLSEIQKQDHKSSKSSQIKVTGNNEAGETMIGHLEKRTKEACVPCLEEPMSLDTELPLDL